MCSICRCRRRGRAERRRRPQGRRYESMTTTALLDDRGPWERPRRCRATPRPCVGFFFLFFSFFAAQNQVSPTLKIGHPFARHSLRVFAACAFFKKFLRCCRATWRRPAQRLARHGDTLTAECCGLAFGAACYSPHFCMLVRAS